MEFRLYRRYQPENGKSPLLGEIKAVLIKDKLINDLPKVAHAAGVSPGTIDNWINGNTASGQDWTTGAVMRSLGYERRWVRVEKVDLEDEIEATELWLKQRNSKPAKARNGHAK